MSRREPIARGVLANVREPQRVRMLDQRAEHPAPAWQIADRPLGLLLHTGGQELIELGALLVQDPQRRVAGLGELAGRLQHTIEHDAQIELGHELTTDVKQAPCP